MSDERSNPLSGHESIPLGIESKVFDPRDPATGSGGAEVSDACVVKRGNQWWMYLAGQAKGYGATDLYSASLPPDAPLSAQSWALTRDGDGNLKPLTGRGMSRNWDGRGGKALSILCPRMGPGRRPMGRTHLLCGRSGESLGAIHDWLSAMERRRMGRSGRKSGNMEASTSRTSSITTINGRCGSSPDPIMRITLFTAMRKAGTGGPVGRSTKCLRPPR